MNDGPGPRGKARRWTKKQIRKLAEPTSDDITNAKRLWSRFAGDKLRKLLDAKPETTEGSKT